MEELKKKPGPKPQPDLCLIELWESQGIPLKWVKFQSPVAPQKDREPVYEFKIEGLSKDKYLVDQMRWCPQGIIWRKGGAPEITPLINVLQARPL